ncbi:Phophatidylserine decarboxylase-domain-containing protein [Trametes elegans]|nr:Phophatidylserine decarboxylase-domain-containing protein [Trametes elegans]
MAYYHRFGHESHVRGDVKHRIGGWLPRDPQVLEKWLEKKITHVEHPTRRGQPLHPVIERFKLFIEREPTVYMGFSQMFEQVPTKPPYNGDPTHKPQVRDFHLMLRLFNHIICTAPDYEDNDLVGFPINAILDWPMGTPAGLSMFSRPDVNEHFKNMFDVWAIFLTSPDSRYVLTDGPNGWFGGPASRALPNFVETYVCDPSAPYHGFKSWDDFFTRQFRPGVRPVQFQDDDSLITSACESAVYRIAHRAQLLDEFWLKGHHYSLSNMLNYDDYAPQFADGTVYQAFLSATKYHRWHAPVNGTVVRIVNVPGTYYAEAPSEGFPHPDPAGPNLSQAFITSMGARVIIFIQARNPAVGLMAFVAVGMAEVSTCEAIVQEGQKVSKGEELGAFHFGGSTHCLVFRKETKISFSFDANKEDNVLLNAPIAKVLT